MKKKNRKKKGGFLRVKTVYGKKYLCLVKNKKINGKVVQKHLLHLGAVDVIVEALKNYGAIRG